VFALAILGLLAVASPADTALRVPGTTLRFGLDDTAISARGFTAAGSGTRTGRCRFFGLTSDATLTFEDGRLARAEFAVSGASTYEIAYVHDQLTAMGYRKSCAQPEPQTEVCDWTARTHIHVEVSGASLMASVVPASAAAVAPAAARDIASATRASRAERANARLKGAPAPAATAARDTVHAPPETLAVNLPGRASLLRDTIRAATPVATAVPAPPETLAVNLPGRASLLRDTIRAATPVAAAVPMLPETLAVNLPGRASRYAQATLLSEPHCDYPEAARAAGIQGRVWVFALVGIDGRVVRVQLRSGSPVLNASALACVRDWSFKPVTWQGSPCRYWVLVPVTFTAH
jgi:TonB family protein